jgi:hypothetical protein
MKIITKISKKLLLIICNLLIINTLCFAQTRQREEINLDEFIQNIFPAQQENLNYEDFYEAFFQLYQDPIDLNSASREELAAMYILSETQINSLLDYRQKFGKFLSIYEIQAIPDFDLVTIRKILPFVNVRQGFKIGQATEHYLVLRTDKVLEPQKGYDNGKYLGSPFRTYARYRLAHPKDFNVGFVVEKDAGETSYADFFSGYLMLKNKGNWKNIVVGDYQVQIGQGLISSAGFFVGKGSETVNTVRRSNLGIRPYGSVVEGNFFRGAAATYQFKNLDITGFYSNTRRDATVSDNGLEREEYVSSLLSTGYHRTLSELDRKNTIGEQDLGIDATLKIRNGEIGVTALQTTFDAFLLKKDVPYNLFEFSGKQNLLLGSHFTYNWQNINFFGEAARSSSGGIGAVGGFMAALSKQVEFSILFRNYDKNFHSFYANSFGENTRQINEQGTYWGLKYSPKRSLTFSAFYDQFKFPWLKYLVSSPSSGYDYLFRFEYKPSKKMMFYAQFHEEHKGKNLPTNSAKTEVVETTVRQNYILNFDYTPSRAFRSQTRLAMNTFGYVNSSLSKGYAIMQDLEGTLGKWQIKSRIAYFSTDNYDSRIYAFENDVLYAVSFPAYYGKGFRTYLIIRRSLTKNLDIWARIARTQVSDKDVFGSGNDQIDAPHKTEIKLQLKYKF